MLMTIIHGAEEQNGERQKEEILLVSFAGVDGHSFPLNVKDSF